MNGTLLRGSVSKGAASDSQDGQQSGTADSLAKAEPPQAGVVPTENFWSHMFSFDSATSAGQRHEQGNADPLALSRTGVAFGALKSLKLSHFFEGLTVTPNFKFFLLFVSLVGWLFVVDFVRKNDHQAPRFNPKAQADFGAAKANADHSIDEAVKGAYPVQISQSHASAAASAAPGQDWSANTNSHRRFGVPGQSVVNEFVNFELRRPSAIQPILHPNSFAGAQPVAVPCFKGNYAAPPAYNVQFHSFNGPCLKTIVTR